MPSVPSLLHFSIIYTYLTGSFLVNYICDGLLCYSLVCRWGKSCRLHLQSEDKDFSCKWNWRSGRKHLAIWMWLGQTILRWKMPIRQAFCRSPGTSRQTRYITFPVSSLFGSVSLPIPDSLSSPGLSFVPHPHGCLLRGGDRIHSLSASSGRAWQGSAFRRGVKQRVIRSRSWRTSYKSACPQNHTPPSWEDMMALTNFPTTRKGWKSQNRFNINFPSV